MVQPSDRPLPKPSPKKEVKPLGPDPVPVKNALQPDPPRRAASDRSDKTSPEPVRNTAPKQVTDPAGTMSSAHLELVDETRLKLHAIAWSTLPEKRIAVINGRIVREGESIEGFQVMRIGTEEVVVREGERKYKLVFKLQ
jgi:hypothetical protein